MNRQAIDELNQVSVETFGVKSKWRKLMDKGEVVEAKETVDHLSIVDGKEVKEKMEIQLLKETKNGEQIPVYQLKRYDASELKAKMAEVKAQQEKFRELIKKLEEESKLKERVKAEVSRNSGSSIKL